jgi:hypothetical protein
MKPTYPLFLFAMVCCLAGCDSNNKTNGGELLVLDMESAIENPQPFDLADLADKIDFIPLDNSHQEALLGDIQAIAESKNRFYVIDRAQNPVRMFDRDGKFIATRGRIGRGPDEFLFIQDVVADWENDNLYLVVSNGNGNVFTNSMRAYRADGNIFARNDSISNGKIVCFDDKVLLFVNSPMRSLDRSDVEEMIDFMETFSPELHREAVLKTPFFNGSSRISLVTTDADGEIANFSVITAAPMVVSNNGASLLVKKEGRNDTLYHYNKGALEPLWRLDFGSYAIPDEMFDTHYNKTLPWDNFYLFRHIYAGDRYILATDTFQPPAGCLLFDRQEGYAGFSAIGPDGKKGLFLDGIRFQPAYIRDNCLVGYMSVLDILDNAESITNPDLKALAATLKEDSNPVIVIAKLKK